MPATSRLEEALRRRVGADVPAARVDTEDFVQVAGRKIFYQEAGERENPLVLFLHGAGAPPEHLPVLIKEIASRGFFVVAPEHPGMGRSEHLPAYQPNFFQRYALAYHDFLRKRNLREPIIIAQSFGGGPAGALAGLRHEHLAGVGGDTDRAGMDEYRPRALVLVDSIIAEPLSQRGFRGLYGWLLENLEPVLRVPRKGFRNFLTSFFTGTPATWYRNDVEGDASFARELGGLFRASTRGRPMVEVDLAEYIVGGEKERPVILIWGEKDGTRLLDYGEWGAKVTALCDARALHRRLRRQVAARRSPESSERLVRMAVIPGAGHAGLYTRSHMRAFVDEVVRNLRESGIVS